jgi:hypothetical protein
MPEKDRLDLLIDSAIATYAEPPVGLEDRLLRACADERIAPPAKSIVFPVRRLLPLFIGLSAAACVLLALWVHDHQAIRPMQTHNSAPPQTLPTPSMPPVISDSRAPRTRPRRPEQTRTEPHLALASEQPAQPPRLDVFPTPEPMTPAEQALVDFIARAPEPKVQALLAAQQQSKQPLTIQPIQIPPIDLPDGGSR